jgi:hypothetical protein
MSVSHPGSKMSTKDGFVRYGAIQLYAAVELIQADRQGLALPWGGGSNTTSPHQRTGFS